MAKLETAEAHNAQLTGSAKLYSKPFQPMTGEPSRLYAALRNIEDVLESTATPEEKLKRIKKIVGITRKPLRVA
jgi:hypothetical protein